MDRLTSEHETLLRQGSYCSDCLSDSDWSESSILSSCSSSSSDHSSYRSSLYHGWKDEILPNGEVFHVKSERLRTEAHAEVSTIQNESPQKNGTEKSTKEKLVRLIRRRNSRRIRKKHLSDFVHDSDKASTASKGNLKDKGSNPLPDEAPDANNLDDFYSSLPFGVMYFHINEISETDCGDQGLIYCYPRPFSKNLLYNIKGALIMLYQLLSDITVSPLISSSIVVNDHLCHIIFTPQNFQLMVFAVLDVRCSRAEAVALNADLVRFLEFNHQTLSSCFCSPGNHAALDNLFSSVFARLFQKGSEFQKTAEDKMSLLSTPAPCCFEEYAPVAHWLSLPRDAQVQIDDALSELESNDFAEISDAHYGCQREYTIVASCIFYKSYLLASHMNQQDLVDVASFCRHHNLLRLAHNELIKSMVIWREVYLSSCDRGLSRPSNNNSYKLPRGRWFLLIVGRGHTMLAVALEAGGCTVKASEGPSPDSFYVKQALDTLKHIIKIGVISLIEHWMPSYPRSQPLPADSVDVLKSSPKSVENLSHSSHSSSPQGTKKGQESGSMTRMNPDRVSLSLSCGGEDTSSSVTSDVGSVSHGPVIGRRAQREKAQSSFSDSNSHYLDSDCELSDSDLAHSQLGLANAETNFRSRSSINSVESSIPSKISGGDVNLLFHFIQLDRTEGILISPPYPASFPQSNKLKFIINNFRSSVYAIQRIFENTIRFKKLNGLEVERSVMNNSLIAIKEHGILFECPLGGTDSEKKNVLTYWVVGRLFFLPQPREIFVCYQDTVSQNMIEIAFRIGFVSAG